MSSLAYNSNCAGTVSSDCAQYNIDSCADIPGCSIDTATQNCTGTVISNCAEYGIDSCADIPGCSINYSQLSPDDNLIHDSTKTSSYIETDEQTDEETYICPNNFTSIDSECVFQCELVTTIKRV